MKSVVLSTTEAEYMALSEVVKELKFIVQLLQTCPSHCMWTMLEQSGYQTTGQPVIEQSLLISELLL